MRAVAKLTRNKALAVMIGIPSLAFLGKLLFTEASLPWDTQVVVCCCLFILAGTLGTADAVNRNLLASNERLRADNAQWRAGRFVCGLCKFNDASPVTVLFHERDEHGA